MEIQNIIIFALIGAVVMVVVTGGVVSMMGKEDGPQSTHLFGGALVGGALGTVGAYLTDATTASLPLMSSFTGSDIPDMKIGLPVF